MSGKRQLAKAKKEKAKLYRNQRGFWLFNPVTRVKQNKKKDIKPSFED